MPAKDQIKALIAAHQRRLQMLKAQQGASQDDANLVDPGILIEIEDLEIRVEELQQQLSADDVKNKDKLRQVIRESERRLQKLKERRDATKQNVSHVEPRIQMEIEDLEVELQELQQHLSDDTIKNKADITRIVRAKERRLQALKAAQAHPPQQSRDKEIREIEAEIQRLQTELDNLA
jgi:hypothetical protein